MSKQQDQSPKILSEEYLKLKDKIVNGTVTKEEVEKLHADFNAYNKVDGKDIAKYQNKGIVTRDTMEDLGKSGISKENMHKFVGQLFEIETKIEIDKINQGKQSTGVMRENGSLLKPALTLECTINGFGKDIFETVKNQSPYDAIEKLANIEVPTFLQEHFSKMQQTYNLLDKQEDVQKHKNTAGNTLVFNALSNSIATYATTEKNPAEVIKKYTEAATSVYTPKDPSSFTVLDAKINGKTPNSSDLEALKKSSLIRYEAKQDEKAQKVSQDAALKQNQTESLEKSHSQIKQNPPALETKAPGFFDKLKAFAKETVNKVLDKIVPGRAKLNEMLNNIDTNSEPVSKKQTNDLHKDNKGRMPRLKNKNQQKIASGVKVESPQQTPQVKASQQNKGRGSP